LLLLFFCFCWWKPKRGRRERTFVFKAVEGAWLRSHFVKGKTRGWVEKLVFHQRERERNLNV